MKQVLIFCLVFLFIIIPCASSYGTDAETVLKALEKNLLNVLERKGLLTREEREEILDKTRRDIKASAKKEGITSSEKEDIKNELEELRKEVKAVKKMPEWLANIKWNGDLRVRHDSQWFDREESIADRHRERIRARLGFTYDLNELTQIGFQLATGNTDQITTNQTMGDVFETKNIMLDMVYLRHEFFDEKLTLYAGKFKNPFNPSSWIVFDPDLRPEGISFKLNNKLSDSANIFLNAGVFPLDELKLDSNDPWLFGIQGGFKLKKEDIFEWVMALAHYHYTNTELVDDDNYSGNTDDDFRVYNPTTTLSVYTLPVFIGLTGDYVYNSGADDENDGWLLGIKTGHKEIKAFKDWQLFATYSRLESDATFDEFPDSDFHSGGTNNRGWTSGYIFGLGKGWVHNLKFYYTKEVSGEKKKEKRIQVDLNYKF